MKKIYTGVIVVGLFAGLTACAPKAAEEKAAIVVPMPATETVRLDEREILPLNQMQRQQVLGEMRGLLVATQGVVEGLARDDMQMVADAANAVSMQAHGTVENKQNMKRLKMGQVLPPEFRQLGRGLHIAFGDIAQMATDGKPAKEIQLKLADTMNSCVACHSAYQIPNP
ncbi:MAG: hypothetical protein L3J05_08175 [Robiginitomaculum sp.]|nr:hypothetical protein [Robiginitomaculum sp.]